jgi:hypothetical protein
MGLMTLAVLSERGYVHLKRQRQRQSGGNRENSAKHGNTSRAKLAHGSTAQTPCLRFHQCRSDSASCVITKSGTGMTVLQTI